MAGRLLYTRFMNAGSRPGRWWDATAVTALALAFFFSASRLQTTNWTQHLGTIQLLVFPAVGLGLLLGYSRFRGLTAALFALLYTLGIPGMILLSLLNGDDWLQRLVSLGERLLVALQQLVANIPISDPIFFLTLMFLLYWGASFGAGFGLARRGKPWAGLAAAGVMVLIVEYSFDIFAAPNGGTAFTFLYVLALMVILARIHYLNRNEAWQQRGDHVEGEVSGDLARAAAVTGLVLALGAWFSPAIIRTLTPGSNENLQLTAQVERIRERFSNAFIALRSPSQVVVVSLGGSMALGQGTSLSEEVVFFASPGDPRQEVLRYYWAGRKYDTYEDGFWSAQEIRLKPLGNHIGPYEYNLEAQTRMKVNFVSMISAMRTLYFPGALVKLDRPAQGVSLKDPWGEEDFTAVLSEPVLRESEMYTTESLISSPTVSALRETEFRSYPSFIAETYTQLPDGFSPRIRQLAVEITTGISNPYDRAVAITDYLRRNIRYEAVLPEVPPDVDPMEWFLFDHQAGFCNYYASAEVLLLRSRGIPARLAVGYSSGIWDEERRRYEVRGLDYHAWPEVFFPGIGWVIFEPTASQRELIYPQGEGEPTIAGAGGPAPTPTIFIPEDRLGGEGFSEEELRELLARNARQRLLRRVGIGAGIGLALGLLVFAILHVRRALRRAGVVPLVTRVERLLERGGFKVPDWLVLWSRKAQRTPLEQEFAVVPETLEGLGYPQAASATPRELSREIDRAVPAADMFSEPLLREFEKDQYSPSAGDLAKAQSAASSLRRLAWPQVLRRRLDVRKARKRKPGQGTTNSTNT